MPKLHYCENGISVTDQVITYQSSRDNSDYLPLHEYYGCYKDYWFSQVSEYIDRTTFNSEFDFKLYWSVCEFDADKANELAEKYKWNKLGNFNRWFYRVLCNWRSNVKTSKNKKRPPVQCPCCGRYVSRITEEHLQHYKSTSDLPVAFSKGGYIYQTVLTPDKYAWCWGKYSRAKLTNINNHKGKKYSKEKVKVVWPWEKEGQPMVICPFTKSMVQRITEKYIRSLPEKYGRYSLPISWQQFIKEHPMVLVQSEIYSLDCDQDDDGMSLKDTVGCDHECGEMNLSMVFNGDVTAKYEPVFHTIDKFICDGTDRRILKLTAIGYKVEDIAETLSLAKKEIKQRLESIKQVEGLEIALESV